MTVDITMEAVPAPVDITMTVYPPGDGGGGFDGEHNDLDGRDATAAHPASSVAIDPETMATLAGFAAAMPHDFADVADLGVVVDGVITQVGPAIASLSATVPKLSAMLTSATAVLPADTAPGSDSQLTVALLDDDLTLASVESGSETPGPRVRVWAIVESGGGHEVTWPDDVTPLGSIDHDDTDGAVSLYLLVGHPLGWWLRRIHPATGGGGAVDSVNGQTGVVVLDAADVGSPPTSRTLAGLDLSADRSASDLKTALTLAKGDVGLGNVTNDAQIPKSLVDAKGDLLVGTADNTPARLAAGTNGHVLTADSAATEGVKWAPPASGGASNPGWLRLTDSRVAETIPMWVASANQTLTSGRLLVVPIVLPATPITHIGFASGTTGLSGGTNQWFAIFDSALNLVAVTGDDTSTAWSSGAQKELAITGGPYTPTAGEHRLGIMVAASAPPTLRSVATPSGAGTSGAGNTAATGQTVPPTIPFSTTLSLASNIPYGWVR